ncbi:hypothetical protein HUK45_01480 [Limosilactobacillus sp. c9Ua_26_M]|uniref:DUF5067 domain-containing protein n=1 Tax=Limosilactobacillus urinaemulieris TaxID=2742600 RepID=A0ABR8ZI33_9LACO|nr:hypothetical protein [Limosilactobacillus urinaemulieris]MBD8084946.1 hypothetical protein [Limosilactobacillus urinaemulieris]
MFFYIVSFIVLVALGVIIFRSKRSPKLGRIVGTILILFGIMVLYFGHIDTDWSAGASNWDDISSVNEHVTDEDTQIKNVKKYNGYMLITLKKNAVNFGDTKTANAANLFDQCFKFAKDAKNGVADKGVIIYQPTPNDGPLNGFAVLYTSSGFSKMPSLNKMLDDRSSILKQSTAYSLGGANYNSTGLDKMGVKIQSSNQPNWFMKFCGNRYIGE